MEEIDMIQWFTKQKNNEKGFTLIELLIVLAVMALIATIAFPAFTGLMEGFKFKADVQTANAIARQIESRYVTGIETVGATSDTEITTDVFGDAIPDSKLEGTFKYTVTYNSTAKTGTITVYLDRDSSTNNWDSDDPTTTSINFSMFQ